MIPVTVLDNGISSAQNIPEQNVGAGFICLSFPLHISRMSTLTFCIFAEILLCGLRIMDCKLSQSYN